MTRPSIAWLLSALVTVSFAAPARAADDTQLSLGNGWTFSATPYFWFPSVSGQETIKGRTADVNASFSDIFNHTDKHFGFLGNFEAWHGDFGAFVNANYLNLGQSDIALGPTLTNVNFQLTVVDFGVLYHVHDWNLFAPATPIDTPQKIKLDTYLGGRFTNIYGKLEVQSIALVDTDKYWTDPLLGARLTTELTDVVSLILQADVGGTSSSSDFTWSATGLVSFRFTMWGLESRALLGYRALTQNWVTDSGDNRFRWNTTLHGPVLGLNVKF